VNTHYASYRRASRDQIIRDYRELSSLSYLSELIGALPYVATILNQDRQIVFSNKSLLKKMGIDIEEVLGKRPGEALNCKHADLMQAGCGTSENCQVCGAVNTILKCQETGQTATDECRIRVNDREGYEDCLDLEVTATPFLWGKQKFIIFAVRDISSEKRKEALERIFFHDVINTAGTLKGVVVVSQDLTEEILNQKSLLAAENGELAVKKQKFYLRETLGHIVKEYRRHELALNKEIVFLDDPCEITIHTDPVLLRRVISNMIKNALEAIRVEERVTIECSSQPGSATIRVHNPGVMSETVKKQVFQRSFSTKGKGRGLGTYSMKLLGEKYLGGKVHFSSLKNEGTVFSLQLPLS
jgi:PAS domain-containing protein